MSVAKRLGTSGARTGLELSVEVVEACLFHIDEFIWRKLLSPRLAETLLSATFDVIFVGILGCCNS